MWDATSFTTRAAKQGLKSQREVVVPALATEKLTEPRVDVGAWGHPGLPHMRLDLTVVDAEALHYSSVMRKAQEQAPQQHKRRRRKKTKMEKTKGGIGVMGIALQLSGRFGPGLDTLLRQLAGYKRAIAKAAGKSQRTTPTGMADTPERRAGQIYRCDHPLGRRASGLERKVSALALTFA